jgi:serine protease Do
MRTKLARRVTLILTILLTVRAPAIAGSGFNDPALVARLLPSVVAIDIDVPAPTAANPAAQKLEHASGFVISPDGTILTNGHVVHDATAIRVVLHDGTVLPARLIFQAPIDLAMIQVDAGRPLPAVIWGDSNRLRPGDGVLAIGNPLGIGLSVSAGVVSAVGRDIHATPHDDFIQTDAALNHGNSGGPLFDLRGEVIGVTTGLLTPKGESGSIGIGLALPGNTARFVVSSFFRYGRLREGWLGARVAALTPAIADSLGFSTTQGVLVTAVPPQTPAAHGGMQAGDVILRLGDQPITDPRDLHRLISTTPPGETLHLAMLRNGRPFGIAIVVGEAAEPPGHGAPPGPPLSASPDLGLQLAPLDQDARARFHIPAEVSGVLVAGITANSAAAGRGLAAGNVIVRAQWSSVAQPADVRAQVAAARQAGRGHVMLGIIAAGGLRLVTIPLHARPEKSVPPAVQAIPSAER